MKDSELDEMTWIEFVRSIEYRTYCINRYLSLIVDILMSGLFSILAQLTYPGVGMGVFMGISFMLFLVPKLLDDEEKRFFQIWGVKWVSRKDAKQFGHMKIKDIKLLEVDKNVTIKS